MDYVYVNGDLVSADELYHHGIKGMKWGVRRYQNKDGSLTPAGKKRYSVNTYELTKAFPNKMKTVRTYWKQGDHYRGKAYGTGNILDGTYKPPKDDSDEAFAKNMRKSNEYYRKANLLERDLRTRLSSQKLQSERNETFRSRQQKKLSAQEGQALMTDADAVTAKAPAGRHMMVTSSHLMIGNQTAHHLVDDQGNVRMSYIRGLSGDRYLASGKDYIDKLDLKQYFIDTNDMNIEYDIYD